MKPIHYVLIALGALIVLLLLIIIIKALCFKDKTNYNVDIPFETKNDDIVYKLGELIKIQTVSHEDRNEIDFYKFQEYIDKTK